MPPAVVACRRAQPAAGAPASAPHVDSHAGGPGPRLRIMMPARTLHYAAPAISYQATRDATMAAALLRSRTSP